MSSIEGIEKRIDWGAMLLLMSYGEEEANNLSEVLYKSKVDAYEQAVWNEARRMGFDVLREDVKLENAQALSQLKKQAQEHASYIINTHNKDLEKKLTGLEEGPKYPLKNRFQLAQDIDQWAADRFAKRAQLIARTESFTPMMLGTVDFYRQNGIETEFIFDSAEASCHLCKTLKATSPHPLKKVMRVGIPHPNCVHSWTPVVKNPTQPPGGSLWMGGPYRSTGD